MKLNFNQSRSSQQPKPLQPKRSPPPNYSARREQLRLFILCSMLMLVLAMMNEARKPSTWDWMWAGSLEANAQETEEEQPIDTKLDEVNPPRLPPDGFRATLPTSTPSTFPDNETDDYLPEITAELLSPIQDNTVMRAAENPAWLAMLEALNSRSQDELLVLSTGRVGFAQLFRQTDVYRGRLVTVQGTARRLEKIIPRPNKLGITELYRWVLKPAGSTSPIIIYSLEKPPELQPAPDLREICSFTGLCFKRWAYPSADGTRVAPLLLAKTADWQPAPPPAEPVLPSLNSLGIVVLSLVAMAAAIAFFVHRTVSARRTDIDRLRMSRSNLDSDLKDQSILPNTFDALSALEDTHHKPLS